jgi:hypothetical protein
MRPFIRPFRSHGSKERVEKRMLGSSMLDGVNVIDGGRESWKEKEHEKKRDGRFFFDDGVDDSSSSLLLSFSLPPPHQQTPLFYLSLRQSLQRRREVVRGGSGGCEPQERRRRLGRRRREGGKRASESGGRRRRREHALRDSGRGAALGGGQGEAQHRVVLSRSRRERRKVNERERPTGRDDSQSFSPRQFLSIL